MKQIEQLKERFPQHSDGLDRFDEASRKAIVTMGLYFHETHGVPFDVFLEELNESGKNIAELYYIADNFNKKHE